MSYARFRWSVSVSLLYHWYHIHLPITCQLVASVPGLQHPGSASSSSTSSSATATPIPVAAAPAINAWGLPPPLPKHKQQEAATTVAPQQQQQQQQASLLQAVSSLALNGTPLSPSPQQQQQQQQQSSLYPLQQTLPQLFTEDPPLLLQRSASIGSSSGLPASPPHSAIAGPGISSVNMGSSSSSSVAPSLPMVSACILLHSLVRVFGLWSHIHSVH
jgi:hypothetical protein